MDHQILLAKHISLKELPVDSRVFVEMTVVSTGNEFIELEVLESKLSNSDRQRLTEESFAIIALHPEDQAVLTSEPGTLDFISMASKSLAESTERSRRIREDLALD